MRLKNKRNMKLIKEACGFRFRFSYIGIEDLQSDISSVYVTLLVLYTDEVVNCLI
jgi:hypothetical protein